MSSFTTYPTSSQHKPQSPPIPQLRQGSQRMSITQTFYLAHKARGKLSSEASRSDHNLRLLVGHANLLDALMIHLSEAERDQEMWYNNMVRGNEESKESVQQWSESIPEETGEYGSLPADYESDSDSSSDEDEDEDEDESENGNEVMEYFDISYAHTRESPSPYKYYSTHETVIGVSEVEEDFEEDEGDEDGMFSLTRTTSHRPPSLCSDLSDDEEEDSNPPSPPQPILPHPPISHKERAYFEQEGAPGLSDQRESLFEDDYFLPSRSPTVISTF